MKHKTLHLIIFSFLLLGATLQAQQSPRFIQFLYNESAFNPAMAGVNGTEAFLYHRQEWTGLNDGIFSSQVAGGSIRPFGSLQKVGIGAMLMMDQAHIIKTGQYGLTFAYQLLDGTLTPHRLSIGVLGGIINKRFDFQDGQLNSAFDAFLFDEAVNQLGFNFGMGASFSGPVGPGILTVNAASTQSNQNFEIKNPDGDFLLGLKRNVIASARYRYPLNEDIAIEPAVLFKTLLLNSELQNEFLLGLRGSYKDLAYAGLVYSTASSSVGLVVGVNLGKANAGGAFELPLGSSSDLGLTYELGIHYNPGVSVKPTVDTASVVSTPTDTTVVSPEPEIEIAEEKPAVKEEKEDPKPEEEVVAEQPKPEEEADFLLTQEQLIKKYNQSEAVALRTRISLDILPEPNGQLIVLTYKYTDLYAGYNNIPPVEKLIAHLQNDILDDLRTQGFSIANITVTTNSSEGEAILQRETSTMYNGEFGSIIDINYQINGQNTNITIPEGQRLTIQQTEYLKLFRLSDAFKTYTQKVDMRLNTGKPVFETAIEIIVK